eukprot:8538559-Pyramimonas_sp.AAC.1
MKKEEDEDLPAVKVERGEDEPAIISLESLPHGDEQQASRAFPEVLGAEVAPPPALAPHAVAPPKKERWDIKKEPEIAMEKWHDVKPNFDPSKNVTRLKETTDKKELMHLLLGFHIRFWHAPGPDMI